MDSSSARVCGERDTLGFAAAIENDNASKNISAVALLATSSVNLFAQLRSDNMEQLKALLKMCQKETASWKQHLCHLLQMQTFKHVILCIYL